jgi:Flp pilus assembly protein TadG
MTRTVSARRARDDRGSVTLLMIGATMIVMFVGWIAFTMWNGSNERRQLAAAADQAAQAGATALDVTAFRATGVRQLDPAAAEQRAIASLADQDIEDKLTDYAVNATAGQIVVALEGQVDVGLLRIFHVNGGPIEVRVTAVGIPSQEAP